MRKQPFHTFKIDCEVLGIYALFVITKDYIKACGYINNHFDDTGVNELDFEGCNGKMFYKKNQSPLIWIPFKPITPSDFGVLNHEIFHAVYFILNDWANTPLCKETEELYAKTIKYITEKALLKLDKL